MTRKDYQLIADAINLSKWSSGNDIHLETIRTVAQDLATKLAQENPRFDRARFLTACGVN
jgi:hypothetical protein